MPDSFGKRQRREVKAKAAAAREERRVARNRRREDRAAGVVEEPDLGAPLDGPTHQWDDDIDLDAPSGQDADATPEPARADDD
jgi:hypothetical protein